MKWKTHIEIANHIINLLDINYKYIKIFKDGIISPDKGERTYSHHMQSKFISLILFLKSKYYFNKNDLYSGYKYLGEALHLAQDFAIGYGSFDNHIKNEDILSSNLIDKTFKHNIEKILPKKRGFLTFLKYFNRLTKRGFLFIFNTRKWLQKKYDNILLNSLIITYLVSNNTKNKTIWSILFFITLLLLFLAILSIYNKLFFTFIFLILFISLLFLASFWYI